MVLFLLIVLITSLSLPPWAAPLLRPFKSVITTFSLSLFEDGGDLDDEAGGRDGGQEGQEQSQDFRVGSR